MEFVVVLPTMSNHSYARLSQDEELQTDSPPGDGLQEQSLLDDGGNIPSRDDTLVHGFHYNDYESRLLISAALIIVVPTLTGLVWWFWL